MKIAYLLHFNFDAYSGVYKKIERQVKWWTRFGCDVRIFLITRNVSLRNYVANNEIGYNVSITEYPGNKCYRSFLKRLASFNDIIRDILNWSPDIIYTRQDLYYPQFDRIIKNNTPFILEINTYDIGELWIDSRLKWFYNLLTRHKLLSSAAGFVFVTNELSQKKDYKKFKKPYRIISNGIDLDEIKPLPYEGSRDKVNLVFIGSEGCPWHGVDKIYTLAQCIPNWTFHLIGINKAYFKKNVPNIVCHGFLKFDEYIKFVKEADCAIGTLALHRNHIDEASPLKTREYLAFGLPVIIGYKDTDFPYDTDFILRLPNTEDNVVNNISRIKKFVEKWRGKRIPRNRIMSIDNKEKEKRRILFFESLLRKERVR